MAPYSALYSALRHATMMYTLHYTLHSVMAPWCILCIILCSTSCHYDVYSAVRHATMMYTLHYTLQSVLVPWCILCIILCIPSCHHHECSVCILLPWWMQSKHVHSALISYSEPASLQDKCRVCKLCLILCLNLWSPPPLHIQYSARILECISIRKYKFFHSNPLFSSSPGFLTVLHLPSGVENFFVDKPPLSYIKSCVLACRMQIWTSFDVLPMQNFA